PESARTEMAMNVHSNGLNGTFWLATSVRCVAAIFPESEVDRTRSRTSRKRRSWPKAAELGDAIGRQLSGGHRTCCRRSRDGSPRRTKWIGSRLIEKRQVG